MFASIKVVEHENKGRRHYRLRRPGRPAYNAIKAETHAAMFWLRMYFPVRSKFTNGFTMGLVKLITPLLKPGAIAPNPLMMADPSQPSGDKACPIVLAALKVHVTKPKNREVPPANSQLTASGIRLGKVMTVINRAKAQKDSTITHALLRTALAMSCCFKYLAGRVSEILLLIPRPISSIRLLSLLINRLSNLKLLFSYFLFGSGRGLVVFAGRALATVDASWRVRYIQLAKRTIITLSGRRWNSGLMLMVNAPRFHTSGFVSFSPKDIEE